MQPNQNQQRGMPYQQSQPGQHPSAYQNQTTHNQTSQTAGNAQYGAVGYASNSISDSNPQGAVVGDYSSQSGQQQRNDMAFNKQNTYNSGMQPGEGYASNNQNRGFQGGHQAHINEPGNQHAIYDQRPAQQNPRRGTPEQTLYQDPRQGSGLDQNQRQRTQEQTFYQGPRQGSGLNQDPMQGSGLNQNQRQATPEQTFYKDPRQSSGLNQDPRHSSGPNQDQRQDSGSYLRHQPHTHTIYSDNQHGSSYQGFSQHDPSMQASGDYLHPKSQQASRSSPKSQSQAKRNESPNQYGPSDPYFDQSGLQQSMSGHIQGQTFNQNAMQGSGSNFQPQSQNQANDPLNQQGASIQRPGSNFHPQPQSQAIGSLNQQGFSNQVSDQQDLRPIIPDQTIDQDSRQQYRSSNQNANHQGLHQGMFGQAPSQSPVPQSSMGVPQHDPAAYHAGNLYNQDRTQSPFGQAPVYGSSSSYQYGDPRSHIPDQQFMQRPGQVPNEMQQQLYGTQMQAIATTPIIQSPPQSRKEIIDKSEFFASLYKHLPDNQDLMKKRFLESNMPDEQFKKFHDEITRVAQSVNSRWLNISQFNDEVQKTVKNLNLTPMDQELIDWCWENYSNFQRMSMVDYVSLIFNSMTIARGIDGEKSMGYQKYIRMTNEMRNEFV